VFQGSAEPIKASDDQGIPFPEVGEGFIDAGAGGGNTAHLNPFTFTTPLAGRSRDTSANSKFTISRFMFMRVQPRDRGVSFGEVVRDAVEAFDETISYEDADLLDTMADNLIATTNDTIERIDELMKRMDETHAMVMAASHGNRG
jgi:hypothetical protein